jgi:hypothetical protein
MKNEIIQIAKKNLTSGEEIINSHEGKPIQKINFDLKLLKIFGIILFIISLFTFFKSIQKIDWGKEMSNSHGSYWIESLGNDRVSNGNMWKSAENNFKRTQITYRVVSVVLFIASIILFTLAYRGGAKDYYFITNIHRVYIIRLNQPVKYFNIGEIKSIKNVDNNKILIQTIIGETFKVDEDLKAIIESKSFIPIHKT